MPELPEVETLRRYLIGQELIGRSVVEVEARWPGIDRSVDGMGGLSGLTGRRIEGVSRHGKQLVVGLDNGALGLHMGMTGRLGVMTPDEEPFRHLSTTLYLDDERRLELDDPRRWASVKLVDDAGRLTAGLGPDALDPEFTAERFIERVGRRRSAIKSALMDQHVLAGVGNIYADEALLYAGISPARRASRISKERLATLHSAVRDVLLNAVDYIASHPDEHGRPYVVDAHDGRMRIVRKKDAPCPQCSTPQKSKPFSGRTAYYCPACQH